MGALASLLSDGLANTADTDDTDDTNGTEPNETNAKILNHTEVIETNSVAYFNNAGKTILPPSVEKAGIRSLYYEARPWIQRGQDSTTATSEVRTLFAKLVGANADGSEIAICPSTGFALTMAALNLLRNTTTTTGTSESGGSSVVRKGCIGRGDRILIVQDEMSSGVYCWQEICELSGSSLEIVSHPTVADTDDGERGWTGLILDKIRTLGTEIAVVCVPQVHWSDGSLLDLKLVGDACRANNIKFVIDATQSVGILPLNVMDVHCDVLAASVHKWLLGPHGMSLVYIHSKYHDTWLPLDQHERSRRVFQNDVFDAQENSIGHNGYPENFIGGAARCDSGGKKSPILMPMVREGLLIVTRLNLNDSQVELRKITDSILERAKELGFGVQPGPRAAHIIGLRPQTPDLRRKLSPAKMVDIATRLKDKNIFIAVRRGAFRISPYLHTTLKEVDQLILGLAEECKSSI